MQSRCPYADCLQVFEIEDQNEFKAAQCKNCARIISLRSLARHLEIDKQVEKHRKNNTLAVPDFELKEKPARLVAVLEEIRSLWNVGSIFRSADGAGFSSLFLLGITGCPPRKEIAKTSLGAEDHIRWQYAGNSVPLLEDLKVLGYQIISLEKTDGSLALNVAIERKLLKPPICLIVGSETKGVYAETLQASDLVLDLPMRGFKESLNVAVAFGIAAYAIAEQVS